MIIIFVRFCPVKFCYQRENV